MGAVLISKYHYHNKAGHWTFNCCSDLRTRTGTDFYLATNNEQIHSSVFSPVCK
jgi:hypothetical protein